MTSQIVPNSGCVVRPSDRGIVDGKPYRSAPKTRALPRESVIPLSFHRSRGGYPPHPSRRRASPPRPSFPRAAESSTSRERPGPVSPLPKPPMTEETAQLVAASPFLALGLRAPFVRALIEDGYTVPSPVQAEVIPGALSGRDVLASAQTGTGKTAAFVLPILQHLSASESTVIRGLVLTPTRELASQIAERVSAYGRHQDVRHAVIYGGVSQHRQEIALRASPDLVVAT